MIRRLLALLPSALFVLPCPAADVYVAPAGNDAHTGHLAAPTADKTDGPFRTLERARSAVRALRKASPNEPVTIHLRAGDYFLPAGFKLTRDDSGSEAAPVVWRGYQGERPTLIGGRAVTNFVPHKDKVLKADLAAQGLAKPAFSQLIFGSARQPMARWPNYDPANPYGGGWAYADGANVPMYADIPGEDKRTLKYKAADAARPASWANASAGAEVFVFPRYNWWNNIVRIASIDKDARTIKLAGDCSYGIRPGDRYYVQGVIEELDAPGEWYLDRAAATLYFYPPDGAAAKDLTVFVPTTREIVELAPGTHHVTLRNLALECAEGNAILFNQTHHCTLAASVIRNVGDYRGSGVSVSQGTDNTVVGNDISFVGQSGINLSGGDVKTLTRANNLADNNYVHHFGVYYKQGVGIGLGGCGQRVTRNLMHDGPRMGIIFGGVAHTIELNHIRHINLETADTGAIYTGGRDWLGSRGTVIRHNLLTDSLGFGRDEKGRWESPHFSWGVYLDDNAGGVDVIGNIVARAARGPLHLHNGRDNVIANNVFVAGKVAQIECSGWTDTHKFWTNHIASMTKGYEMVADQPAWKAMRHMDLHPKDAVLPDHTIMAGNVFKRNILVATDAKAKAFMVGNFNYQANVSDANVVWNTAGPVRVGMPKPKTAPKTAPAPTKWEDWLATGEDAHSVVADPQFIDPAKDDYRLKPTSPALKLGFEAIPVEKIGPYQSDQRASWPIKEAEGAREKPLIVAP